MQEGDPVGPKVGQHEGSQAFLGQVETWMVCTARWVSLGWKAVGTQAWAPQEDPRDWSM